MSYNKMMKHQRTSIRKHKRRSYTANVICSIPSDKTLIYPPKTSNIADYDISDLTPQQTEIAKVLMEKGCRGQPSYDHDKQNLSMNLFSNKLTINELEVITVKDNFGFRFTF